MKRTLYVSMVLVLFSIFTVGAEAFAAKSLYDDFSGTYIDSQKWSSREFVREVVDGKLISKIGNASGTGRFQNRTRFQNAESINNIECKITVVATNVDTGGESCARIDGFFYNTRVSGGPTGDILAFVVIGDRGSGLEAYWWVGESLDDDVTNWEKRGSGTLIGPETLDYNIPYTAKIEYDGANHFTFTVDTASDSFTGPAQQREAVTPVKGLSTVIGSDGGSGIGYASALFDDVYINNQEDAYDDFSTAPLNQAKWRNLEFVREIVDGKLRLNVQADGSPTDAKLAPNDQTTAYLEAKVLVESGSKVSLGATGIARIWGFYYNESRGPGSGQGYNGSEDDVWARNHIELDEFSKLRAACIVYRHDTPAGGPGGPGTVLYSREFTTPIDFDTEYTLSIEFTGSKLIFKCNDETYQYDITTPTYPPSGGQHRQLRSRVYADPGESGYMKANFDDVYTVSFTLTYLAPCYEASEFLTLPFRTAAISFDSDDNLYTTDFLSDRGTGTIKIRRFEAPNYSSCTVPYSYSSDAWTLNGLDFDNTGTLFASEHFYPLDSGLIRNVFNPNQFINFDAFRPTGIAATGSEIIYFPGRMWSDLEFGNIYKIDLFSGPEEIVREGLVGTGIAMDDSGNIFIATRWDNSIWTSEPYPLRIATFTEYIEELAFDSEGNLYALEGNQDNGTATIIRLIPIPKKSKELAISGLLVLPPTGDNKTDKRIEKAVEHIQKSLADELWETYCTLTMKGKKVFDEERKAVKELMKIDGLDFSDIIDSLACIDKRLARTAIDQAMAEAKAAGCNDEGNNDPECDKTLKEIDKAKREMDKAQKELDHIKKDGTPDPKYNKAIDHYKKAWEHAQKAMKKVPEPEEESE